MEPWTAAAGLGAVCVGTKRCLGSNHSAVRFLNLRNCGVSSTGYRANSLSLKRPTPTAPQEGSRRSSTPFQFPSWDGLGVGSSPQCIRRSEGRLSMKPRVLSASCRQNNRRKALPARCRQHLRSAVSPVRGSRPQYEKSERRLSLHRRIGSGDSQLPPFNFPVLA